MGTARRAVSGRVAALDLRSSRSRGRAALSSVLALSAASAIPEAERQLRETEAPPRKVDPYPVKATPARPPSSPDARRRLDTTAADRRSRSATGGRSSTGHRPRSVSCGTALLMHLAQELRREQLGEEENPPTRQHCPADGAAQSCARHPEDARNLITATAGRPQRPCVVRYASTPARIRSIVASGGTPRRHGPC